MISRIHFIALSLFAALLLPSICHATVNAYRCNGCTAAQYYNAAIAPQELGVRYVYDFVNGNYRKYQVTREPNGNGFTYYADQLTLTSGEQAFFDASATAWNSNWSSLKVTATINATPTFPGSSVVSPSASAYDITRMTSIQNNISDWLEGSPTGFEQRVNDIIAAIKQSTSNVVTDESDKAQLTITITFTNNHKVKFVWKNGSSPVMTEARDGNNNTVPFPLSSANGRTYNLGGGDGGDRTRFEDYVQTLNGIIHNVCGRTVLACVTTQQGVTCDAYPACP